MTDRRARLVFPFSDALPIEHCTDSAETALRSVFIRMTGMVTDTADDEVE